MQLNTVPAVEIIIIQMTDVTLMLNNQTSLSRINWNEALSLGNNNWHYDFQRSV